MLATTAAHSPSDSGDITTAPLRLLKNNFHGTVLCLFSLNEPSDRVIFGALAHSLYTSYSLNPQETEAWKYYNNLRLKQQTSTKNSVPVSLPMQVLQTKNV